MNTVGWHRGARTPIGRAHAKRTVHSTPYRWHLEAPAKGASAHAKRVEVDSLTRCQRPYFATVGLELHPASQRRWERHRSSAGAGAGTNFRANFSPSTDAGTR